MIARMIHTNSSRANQPFVPVDCGSIAPSLLESELFGYKRGELLGNPVSAMLDGVLQLIARHTATEPAHPARRDPAGRRAGRAGPPARARL